MPKQKYANHDDWTKDTNEPRYTVMVDVKQCLEDASQGKPVWCPTKYNGAGTLKCEMEKWGELKALVAGTTSVVGAISTGMSMLMLATSDAAGTVGWVANHSAPSRPFSSAVSAMNSSERLGASFDATSWCAASSMIATPSALSSAPL